MTAERTNNPEHTDEVEFNPPHNAFLWVALEKTYTARSASRRNSKDDTQDETEIRREYANNGLDPTQAVLAAIEQFLNVFPDTTPEELSYSVMQFGGGGPFGIELAGDVDDEVVRMKILHRCSCAHLPVHEYTAYISVEGNMLVAWMTTQARTPTQAFANIDLALKSAGMFAIVKPAVNVTIFSGNHPPAKNLGFPVLKLRPAHLLNLQAAPMKMEEDVSAEEGFTILREEEFHVAETFDSYPDSSSETPESMKVLLKGKLRRRNQDMNVPLLVWECEWRYKVDCYEL